MSRNNPIFQELLAAILFGLLLLAFWTSCKTQPVPAVLPAAHNRDSARIEYIHDSIYTDRWHTIYTKGDTVYIHDSIYFARWKHDSIFVNLEIRDSIPYPVEVQVEVVKEKSPFLYRSGIALWVLIGIFVLAVIVGIVLKFAK